MTRTSRQIKGDAAEEKAISKDRTWKNYIVEKAEKNNKGYDYKRRKDKTFIN